MSIALARMYLIVIQLLLRQLSFSRLVLSGLDPLTCPTVKPTSVSSHHNGVKNSRVQKIL